MGTPDDLSWRGIVVRRDRGRWVVEQHPVRPAGDRTAGDRTDGDGLAADGAVPVGDADELVSALVLADLLADDFDPGARPARTPAQDETGRLRLAVGQLEHALSARVLVEQAIGVIAERGGWTTRYAFELIRRIARSQGRRVHDLAGEVVASVVDPAMVLPEGLPARPRRAATTTPLGPTVTTPPP